MKLGNPRPIMLMVYIAALILSSAGAINQGFESTHVYTIGGILNLIFGGIVIYQLFKQKKS